MAFSWMNKNKNRSTIDEDYTTDIDDIYYGKKAAEKTEGGEEGYGYDDGLDGVGIESNENSPEEVASVEPLMKKTFTPTTCKECRAIVDVYKEGRVVVVGRESLERADFLRLFDYVMGAVQALDGEMRKLDSDTVAFLPYGCDPELVIEELEEAPDAKVEEETAE